MPQVLQRKEPILYIIENEPELLSGLKAFFEPQPINMHYYTHPQAFLNSYDPSGPGCVLADLTLQGMNSNELHLILSEQALCLPLVLMASLRDLPAHTDMLNQGIYAFLEKPLHSAVLLGTIKGAFEYSQKMRGYVEYIEKLTSREKEVFNLIVAGHTNKIIAEMLMVTDKTIEAHRSRIMHKLKARALADLIALNSDLKGRFL